MGKEQEVESLSIRMSIDTAGVIAGLTAVNNLFNKITANAYSTTAEINRMLAALGQLSGVEHGGIGVGNPGEYSPRKPTQPNDPPGSPSPDIPKPSPEPTQPTPTTGRPTQPTVLPRRTTGQRLDYTTRRWVNRIKRLVMPLVAAFGARALWKGFNDGVKMIDTYRKQIGMSTSELDKWAKANQYAGGNQKALLDAMAKFVKETGQSADQFIEMMLHVNELSKSEQEAFLKTKGYSEEAVAIFLQKDNDIVKALAAVKNVAFTDEDIQNVKSFNVQWNRFKLLSQALGNVFVKFVQPIFTTVLKGINAFMATFSKHQTTFKVFLTLLSVALGNVLVRQMLAGAKAGGLLVNVFKALTRGTLSFAKALLLSPITWIIAALGILYILLEDIVGFVSGKTSFIGTFLEKWFGKEFAEDVKESIGEFIDALSEMWVFVKFVLKSIGEWLAKHGVTWKNVGKFIGTAIQAIIAILIGLLMAVMWIFKKIGQFIGVSIGYLVENVPKWWETIVNAVKGWWEALKDGAVQVWEDIKTAISSAIDAVIQMFVGLWESACKYVDKSIDKLKELNPFQDFGESLGSKLYTMINGDPTAKITGTSKLPVSAGNRNINTTQNNTFNITAKDSVEAAQQGLKQAEKRLQPSYIGVSN